jgi:imidazolonepropionase-like amidohydrolase
MRSLVLLAFAGSTPAHADLAISNVTLIDAKHPGSAAMTVIVRGDAIVDVGDARTTAIPAGARVIDGRGRYLLPGLWDAHVHLVDIDEPAFGVLVAHGITSVRDMGGDPAKLAA